MCLSCGCLLPHEDHGKAGYLTIEDLDRSAEIDGHTLAQAVENLVKTVEVAEREEEHQHQ